MSKPEVHGETAANLERAGLTPEQAEEVARFACLFVVATEQQTRRIIAHIWTAVLILSFAFFYFMPN